MTHHTASDANTGIDIKKNYAGRENTYAGIGPELVFTN